MFAAAAPRWRPVPGGLELVTPFSVGIMAPVLYLCAAHAVGYKRLCRLVGELPGLAISKRALDAAFRRVQSCLDEAMSAILALLQGVCIVSSNEISVRVNR